MQKNNDLRLRELAMPLLGKWVPFILLLLDENPRHFAGLKREMKGVSRKVLTETLKNLLISGLIDKDGQASTGFPVYYSLTELGHSYVELLQEVKAWLKKHETEIQQSRSNYAKR